MHDIILTGADDGFIYIWNEKKIIQKIMGHPKAPILTIFV